MVEELAAWLLAHLPPAVPATVVHGDYRVGNLLVAEDAPARISAVLDWELSTIGDPLADLGYLLSMYVDDTEPAPGYPRRCRPSRAEPGSRRARGARASCTRRAPAATRRASPGTSASPTGRPRCSSRTCGSAILAGDRDDDFARAMEQGVPAKLAAAEAAAARDDAAR